MKRTFLTLLLVLSCMFLTAATWQTITNRSHVYDMASHSSGIYFATWGGVEISFPDEVDSAKSGFPSVLTTADGLVSNDIRTLEYIQMNNSLWMGTANDGITIYTQLGVQQLNTSLGLLSNRVVRILEHDAQVLVATKGGLDSYYYLEGVNFPLLMHKYTTQTTEGMLSNSIDAMELAENGYLFLDSAQGINFVHLDSLDVDSAWHSFDNFPGSSEENRKMALRPGYLTVNGTGTVYVHSDDPWSGIWRSYGPSNGLLAEPISSAAMDSRGTLWVSYGSWDENNMLYKRNTDVLLTRVDAQGNVEHRREQEEGLGSKSISRIISQYNSIFLCSWGDGVFFQTDSADNLWSQFQSGGLGFPKISCITTDHNNAAWFGSGGLSTIPMPQGTLGASRYLDGYWKNYTIANSPIHTDNIVSIAVDSRNRKWFGSYNTNQNSPAGWKYAVTIFDEEENIWKYLERDGIKVWDEESQSWGAVVPGSPQLLGNTDVHVAKDLYGNMFISCYDDGFTVLTPNDELLAEFRIPNSIHQRSIYSYHNGRQYFIGTNNDRGLVIWNHDSMPETDGAHWLIPEPAELSNCVIYGVVSLQNPYEGIQHWVAASTGLFMWNENDWFRWDTAIKRYKYNKTTRTWTNDILYYEDEERLYGSVRTTPTAIYLDPFNRVWIGSLENGISMYDPVTERFTNYFQDNSPLLSNHITALGYLPQEGVLLIGTPEGLNTLRIGISEKPDTELRQLVVFPNPFHPDEGEKAIISNHPAETMPPGLNQCRIYDAAGALVRILEENEFARFSWDGKNEAGKACANGVYFVVVSSEKGQRRTAKIALLR